MKGTIGIYFMIAGILAGFYLVFGVLLPAKVYAPVLQQSVSSQTAAPALPEPTLIEAAGVASEGTMQLAYRYERPGRHEQKGKGAEFTVPHGLKTEVEFWKKIYSHYTSDQAVMHDPDDLGTVYGVIDIPHCDEPPIRECLKSRENAVTAEKERIAEKKWGSRTEAGRVRAQTGLKDKFAEGIEASKDIIEKIEKIFAEFGIPKDISKLAFVESMFNTRAYSRSGAAGIWQLMPSTARVFGLKVKRGNDERYDPVKSTYVAARHLTRDYNRLGKWDLAISAYNSGPGRIQDAVNRLGTKNIVRIIRDYSNPSYGFAARNFYPCFLAVLEVYEERDEHFYGKNDS